MNASNTPRLVVIVSTVTALLILATLIGAILNMTTGGAAGWNGDLGGDLLFHLLMTPFLVLGWIILRRQPRNAVGWTLITIGALWALGGALTQYAGYGLLTDPGSLPGALAVAAISSAMWVSSIGLTGTVLLLLFPDGRLPSRRWRPVLWLSVFAIVAATVALIFSPRSLADDGYPGMTNPLGIESLKPVLLVLMGTVVLIPAGMMASAVSVAIRYRRSRGIQRLQLKWLAAAGAMVASLFLVAIVASWGQSWLQSGTSLWVGLLQGIASVSFILVPVAVGIAISRYRLYEIDRIINRTLVYVLLTGALAAVYAGLVLGLGQMARSVGGSARSPIVVAASTLAAAALVRPIRRRIQTVVDRRFYRRKYDAHRTLERFSARLRDEIDLDPLAQHLLGAVRETVEPSTARLWLRPPAGNEAGP